MGKALSLVQFESIGRVLLSPLILSLNPVHPSNTCVMSSRTGIIMDMVWEDMQRALDVHPESYTVRTYEELYLEEQKRDLAQWMEEVRGPRDEREAKKHQRRGPPPDRQRRLGFMAL